MTLFWISCGMIAVTYFELYRSTRNKGWPSAAFYVWLLVTAAVVYIGWSRTT